MRSPNNLRIVLYDPSSNGGICHYTHQLAESLAELGPEVTVVTNEGYELCNVKKMFRTYFLFRKSRLKGILRILTTTALTAITGASSSSTRDRLRDRRTGHGFLQSLKTVRLGLTFLKATIFLLLSRPDIIHFQWVVDRKYDYYFASLLKKLGFKIVYTVHDLLPQDSANPADRAALMRIYRLADRLIVHSQSDITELAETFRIDSNKTCLVPHGSNRFFYPDAVLSKEEARKKLGLQLHTPVVLFFGIIRRYKGLEYLVDAFKRVKVEIPNATLLIAGNVYDGDPEGYQYYTRLIDECRTHERIVCTNGYIPFDKVNYYFSASDVVVLPYVKTYTSGILLTAYAAGRPVVATNTGALKEVVEEGKSGYVVPPRNADALGQAIIQILKNPAHLQTMSSYAKHLADTRYSWYNAAVKTVDVYRALLGRPPVARVRDKLTRTDAAHEDSFHTANEVSIKQPHRRV
jgi:D-inositol-3-phosphate glycosyltransferase